MNENELYFPKEYKFDNRLCSKMNSILDTCYRNCLDYYFHKSKSECIYDIKFKKIANNEMVKLTIIGKNMDLYDLNKNLKVARENGFIFIQINKLTIKIYSHQGYINIR